MGKFKFTDLDIEGMFTVEPTVFEDNRDTSWKHIMKMTLSKQVMI